MINSTSRRFVSTVALLRHASYYTSFLLLASASPFPAVKDVMRQPTKIVQPPAKVHRGAQQSRRLRQIRCEMTRACRSTSRRDAFEGT